MSRPPMTTKQAKKAYRKANKGPKLSKAEQRRIELMEQDRIRKEFEKERNQARARTARERKKAKEDKEKENRKRKGLPLVDVHPSQDTISRFVNRAAAQVNMLPHPILEATKEEDAESATESESAIDAEEQEEGDDSEMDKENGEPAQDSEERGAKRRRLSRQNSNQHPADPLAKMAQAIASESVSRASSVDIDDPVNQDLLQEQLIADVVLASSRKTSNSSPVEQNTFADPEPLHVPPPAIQTAAKVPPPQPRPLQPKLQESKLLGRPCPQPVRPQIARPHLNRQEDPARGRNTFQKPASPYLPAGRSYPGAQMKPPPRFKAPTEPPIYHAAKPKFLPKHLRTPVHQGLPKRPSPLPNDDLPTSTQLFLLDHVDDFFPSPSQEVYELLEDEESEKKAATTARTSDSRGVSSISTATAERSAPPIAQPVEKPNFVPQIIELAFDFPMSTQDFTFSSQDMRDIETPSKSCRSRIGIEPQLSLQQADAAPTVDTRRQDREPPSVHQRQDLQQGHDPIARARHASQGLSADVSRSRSQTPSTNSVAIKLPQATPKPTDKREAPTLSPPKKRMFGSSGPGAEVLVAMERSYQQSRREERAREDERRAQERLLQVSEAARGPDVSAKADDHVTDQAVAIKGCAEIDASQETDYGDIDIGGDDLAFLEDTTWLEDDLDDCL